MLGHRTSVSVIVGRLLRHQDCLVKDKAAQKVGKGTVYMSECSQDSLAAHKIVQIWAQRISWETIVDQLRSLPEQKLVLCFGQRKYCCIVPSSLAKQESKKATFIEYST